MSLHPLDGPQAVIRVDPAPGLVSFKNANALQHLTVSIEVGRVKNINKNPIAEKAVLELEEELLCQPGGGPKSELGLAIATAHLNSCLCSKGLSYRELWTQHNQFTNEQIPLNDKLKTPSPQNQPPLQRKSQRGFPPIYSSDPSPSWRPGICKIRPRLETATLLLAFTESGVSLKSALAFISG